MGGGRGGFVSYITMMFLYKNMALLVGFDCLGGSTVLMWNICQCLVVCMHGSISRKKWASISMPIFELTVPCQMITKGVFMRSLRNF